MKQVEFNELMISYAKEMSLMFTEEQLNQFYKYMNLLIEWNNKINLTAIVKPKEIILKHFIDSLTINSYIDKNQVLVDVGTGAGFPGVPIKIYRPDLKVVLVDSLNKRINFLEEVITQLRLEKIETVHSRIEDFGKDNKYRESFDIVTARAVANLSVLSEYLLPLTKVGGKCICMKGSEISEECDNGKRAIDILGGKILKIDNFQLPSSDISRNIIVLRKTNKTPSKYPRKAGVPNKEPL